MRKLLQLGLFALICAQCVSGCATSERRAYVYKTVEVIDLSSATSVEDQLNRYAEEGWTIVVWSRNEGASSNSALVVLARKR